MPLHSGSYLRTISRDLTYAAIDIGSNAVRLLIGDVVERDDHPVIKKTSLVRVPIRLGADVFDSGLISAAKRDQLIKSLKAFRLLTEVYGAHYLRCCATSAMREASNGQEVMARVEMESGVACGYGALYAACRGIGTGGLCGAGGFEGFSHRESLSHRFGASRSRGGDLDGTIHREVGGNALKMLRTCISCPHSGAALHAEPSDGP